MNVAMFYRDECEFMVGIGDLNFPGEAPAAGQPPKLVFQPSNKAVNPAQIPFSGDFATYEYLKLVKVMKNLVFLIAMVVCLT